MLKLLLLQARWLDQRALFRHWRCFATTVMRDFPPAAHLSLAKLVHILGGKTTRWWHMWSTGFMAYVLAVGAAKSLTEHLFLAQFTSGHEANPFAEPMLNGVSHAHMCHTRRWGHQQHSRAAVAGSIRICIRIAGRTVAIGTGICGQATTWWSGWLLLRNL